MKNLTIYIAIAILVVAAIVAFFIITSNNNPEILPAEEGPVVAVVNGQEITREEFNKRIDEAKQAITAQGQAGQLEDPANLTQLENQVFDQLVNSALVMQEIEKEGITIADEVLEQEYQGIIAQVGGEEAFTAELAKANITDAVFRENIKTQLLNRKYLESKISQDEVVVTDEEVRAFYDQSVEGQENVPSFEEVEEQLKNQLLQTKSNQLVATLIQGLKDNATIEDLR